jgi:hypothetical protein
MASKNKLNSWRNNKISSNEWDEMYCSSAYRLMMMIADIQAAVRITITLNGANG